MNTASLRGVSMVLLAASCWGTTGTAQSFASADLSAYWVGALRLVVSAFFFAAVVWASGGVGAWRTLSPRGVLLGGLAMAAYNLAFFAGVKATGVAIGTAVALGSGPIWAGLLQAIGGQRPAPAWWLGTALAVAGGVAMVIGSSGAGAPVSVSGVVLCLIAGLSYAVYALVNKQLVAAAPPALATLAVFACATLLALPAAVVLGGHLALSARDLMLVGWLGVVATGVAYLLFSHALRHIAAATGVTLALAEPVTAFVLAVVVVGERPTSTTFAGALLVLVGLLVVVLAELRVPALRRA